MKYFISSLVALVAFSSIGCNAIVDPAPHSEQPVKNVADYYLPLKSIGTAYAYCRKSSYGVDTLWMTMQGNDISATMLGNQACYSTGISKTNNYLNNYYYAMNDTEAYTLGKVSCGGTDKYWLDLKSPLITGQTWYFNNTNGSYYDINRYTATVNRRGFEMKMPTGKVFNDVVEVIYTSKSGDSTVKWFARGVGLIYSTSNNPNSDFGDEMRLVEQK